jgi:hypothetical protein
MRRSRDRVMGRRWAAWSALALAIVILIASSLTVWMKRQALNTDNWVDVSTRLLQDEEVRQVVAADLVDSLFANTDVQTRLQQALPPRLDPFAAAGAGLLRQAALTAAEDLLRRPAVQSLWQEANRRAHERLVAILDGETDGLLVEDGGSVVLDLRPLVEQLGRRLGLQVALAPDVGRYTLMRSGQLSAAQDGVRALRTLSLLLTVLVLVLLALAVYLGDGFRREVLRAIAVSLAGVGILLLVIRRMAGDAVVESLTSPATRDAGSAVWLIGTELLRDLALALIVYGVILLVGVLLAGTTRWAIRARRLLAPAMRDHLAMVYAAVAGLFLLFLLWAPTTGSRRLLAVLVLAALTVAGVEVLRRQILRESPPAPS